MEAHILVAEDEARLRTIIRDYFTAHGLTCALAKDGEGGPGAAAGAGL